MTFELDATGSAGWTGVAGVGAGAVGAVRAVPSPERARDCRDRDIDLRGGILSSAEGYRWWMWMDGELVNVDGPKVMKLGRQLCLFVFVSAGSWPCGLVLMTFRRVAQRVKMAKRQ